MHREREKAEIAPEDQDFDPAEFKAKEKEAREAPGKGIFRLKKTNNKFEEYYRKESEDSDDEKPKKQKKKKKKGSDSSSDEEQIWQESKEKDQVGQVKKVAGPQNNAGAPSTQHLEEILSSKVNQSLKNMESKLDEERIRVKDKNDRATVDQCLDPRTLLVLHKLLKNGKLSQIYGCLSTGKEANVYLAEGGEIDLETREKKELVNGLFEKGELAIKVFKTSILKFKDRDRYVQGEFRFRSGHCKNNPRKMVKLWAEKEVRNLKRISLTEGLIKAPRPLLLKNNIIVMEFIGENGIGAPRLKDAVSQIEDIQQTYVEVLFIMRNLYQKCRLVHADFSPYNLLLFRGEVHVIDVSQSVEHDHPMALEFLRRDCLNISEFFQKEGVVVLSLQQAFDFITDITIENESEALQTMFAARNETKGQQELAREEMNENVFKQIYIPRTLQEVTFNEIEEQKEQKQQILYGKLTGLQLEEAQNEPIGEIGEQEEEESSEEESEEGSQEILDEGQSKCVDYSSMTKEQRKEHKRQVKLDNREKRKIKLPKHVKKKAEKKFKH